MSRFPVPKLLISGNFTKLFFQYDSIQTYRFREFLGKNFRFSKKYSKAFSHISASEFQIFQSWTSRNPKIQTKILSYQKGQQKVRFYQILYRCPLHKKYKGLQAVDYYDYLIPTPISFVICLQFHAVKPLKYEQQETEKYYKSLDLGCVSLASNITRLCYINMKTKLKQPLAHLLKARLADSCNNTL
eukprot:TRINITY_DN71817_c0_g1_i1.p2 TRINITY_DN71817_c0_g1~~TRINITY_DN71817_c0_g1_i1.p2  ORF type:complete len:210 (-),score=-7.50 TRINITY_DN71817_c0_g1_i1:378-938(-)